jgi:GNAT superfamily N-acetyltransferase
MAIHMHLADASDVPALRKLIEASVRGLQGRDYSVPQLESALRTVYGVDTRLISDRTYFAAEETDASATVLLVGCGGWSKRKTLYGGDRWKALGKQLGKELGKKPGSELAHGGEDSLLNVATDAAKIRAFFIHPAWARRGVGGLILDACEAAAAAAGFKQLEMGATLTGVPFYRSRGYVEMESADVPLEDGLNLPIVRMWKRISY